MKITEYLQQQQQVFEETLSFAPSENYSFYHLFQDISTSDIGNRYGFANNDMFRDSFPQHENVCGIEKQVEWYMKDVFQSQYMSLIPLSWMHALTMILAAFAQPGDTVFTIPTIYGGHSYTQKIAHRLWLQTVDIVFDTETQQIDYDDLREKIQTHAPKLIYIDQMSGLYNISLLPVVDVLEEVITYYDISHNAAFVVSGDHTHPFEGGFDMCGGSTHKTFPWPKKAFVATNNKELYTTFCEKGSFFVSHNGISEIAMIGMVCEYMDGKWKTYTQNIQKNLQFFARAMKKFGFEIISGTSSVSDNHQLLLDHTSIDVEGLFRYLSQRGVLVNYLPIPFLEGRSAIRMGFQEYSFLWGDIQWLKVVLRIVAEYIWNNRKTGNQEIASLKQQLLRDFHELYVG